MHPERQSVKMVLTTAVFPGAVRMQLKTILNRVERNKSFVYGEAKFVSANGQEHIEIAISPRKNSQPVCSRCGRRGAGYDRLKERRFEFVPLWNIGVFFVYSMRRVDCRGCGVTIEQVPWGDGKCQHTRSYLWFLALWAKRMSWQGVANAFGTTWEHVRNAVNYAVFWGIARRDMEGIKAIGVDEIAWRKGHHYLTLVYQLDEGGKRLLWAAADRMEQSLRPFFELILPRSRRAVEFICSDMWKPYLNVIREQVPQALHVLDRFHVMCLFNKALDKIRAEEARRMQRDGYEPVLKHSRWCLLKRPSNLTHAQTVKLDELMQYNLQSVRAYLQREDFQRFWTYQHPAWAKKFLHEWCQRAMRSRLEPLKKVARTLREHEDLLLNWFRAQGTISAGSIEAFNNKAKLIIKKAYGYRSSETAITALYHGLGALPEPEFTHRFC